MLVNTFFEWEGKRWQLARKEINPFFAHNSVGDITLEIVLSTIDKWGDFHSGDILNETHNMVKLAVI